MKAYCGGCAGPCQAQPAKPRIWEKRIERLWKATEFARFIGCLALAGLVGVGFHYLCFGSF